jgi:Na+-translocating ferredoxin:NAD+ oxidoreductase RNF subunit RnfB
MGNILIAAVIMAGLGLFFAVILAVAHRFLHVPEDPRLEKVEEMLPGTNCGACGSPGCHAFAESLVEGSSSPGQCTVSSSENISSIAGFLGVEAGAQLKRVAKLHCAGGRTQAQQMAFYEGFESCQAASLVSGGGKGCSWGCLGLADCERVCNFDAISMSGNGLPVVDVDLCTACGDCVEICPKNLFELLPLDKPLLVQCKTPLSGEEAMALCSVACDGCSRCTQDAPEGLMQMKNNLPCIDYSLNLSQGPEPTFRCPTGAIQWTSDSSLLVQHD